LKHLNVVLNHFWKRWQIEYLLELRESHRQQYAGSSNHDTNTIDTNDVEILQEDKPRAFSGGLRTGTPISECIFTMILNEYISAMVHDIVTSLSPQDRTAFP
jgi:hypothetical protein